MLAFVINFGAKDTGCKKQVQSSFAAKVNADIITVDEFKNAYQSRMNSYQRLFAQGLPKQLLKQLKLKNQVLDSLIDERLLKQAAQAQHISAADEEIKNFLLEQKAFQKEGHFDFELYQRYLDYVGMSPHQFEEKLRADLATDKFRQLFEVGVQASEDELLREYTEEHDQVDLAFVEFLQNDLKPEEKPKTDEIVQFEKSNADDIKKRYERDASRFDEPKKLHARHILVKVQDSAPEAEQKKAKDKINQLEKSLKSGADFAELAKKESEDSSKEKGGDLGFFGPGMMVKPFEDAAYKLKVGEISPIVKSPFGYHLIKLEEIKDAKHQTLEQVSKILAEELLTEKIKKTRTQETAQKVLAQLKKGDKIDQLFSLEPTEQDKTKDPKSAKNELKTYYKTTGLFNQSSASIPKIGPLKELFKQAFTATQKDQVLDNVFEQNQKFIVAVVKDRQMINKEKFEQERDTFRKQVLSKKQFELVQQLIKKQKETAKIEKNETLIVEDEG